MKRVLILGTGCSRCKALADRAEMAVAELGIEATVEKIADLQEIMTFSIAATPGLVVDGAVKACGRVPSVAEITAWLAETSCCQGTEARSVAVDAQSCYCEQLPQPNQTTPCCGPDYDVQDRSTDSDNAPWVIGNVETDVGAVCKVDTTLKWADRLGSWKVRWGINRTRYRVKPRLYATGTPSSESPVFVTANYKLSFDRLRSALHGIDSWILVLDTKGVNVWCAAGKGTFGTDEIVRQVGQAKLKDIVSHNLMVPEWQRRRSSCQLSPATPAPLCPGASETV